MVGKTSGCQRAFCWNWLELVQLETPVAEWYKEGGPICGFFPPLSLCHPTGSILPNSNPDEEKWSKIFKAGVSSLHQLGLLLTGSALLSYIYIIGMSWEADLEE